MKVLLLEDDILLNKAIETFLSKHGHEIVAFRDGKLAQNAIENNTFDLLLLDIHVPKLSGLDLLEVLHNQKILIPTIVISSLVGIENISKAFDLGCYDYMKKPFHLKELVLRIDKLLQSSYIPKSHIRLSKYYSFDKECSILRFKGESQMLSERQLQIMSLLANNRNRIVSYEQFNEYVWSEVEVETPTIRAEVNRLKKILKEDIIMNIRNMGYMIQRPI